MPKILVLPGDGVGVEVTEVSLAILKEIGRIHDVQLTIERELFGGSSIDKFGIPVTDEVLNKARSSDAVLLGAVGGPTWDRLEYNIRPERGLLALRRELDTYANLRPAFVYPSLSDASTLKKEVIDGVDIMVIRELTGGIYFGTPRGIEKLQNGDERGINTLIYTTSEIERVARMAFRIAAKRRKKVTSVDKANVLEVMELWRKSVTRIGAEEFPEIELEHLYVDNAAMQLIRRPKSFDVILADNMFGDIISDEAAQLTGSLGMLPSASIGAHGAIYEPVHGSAPDISGKDIANPIASVLSLAMLFRFSLALDKAADDVEAAVKAVLKSGYRTADIFENGAKRVGCSDMGRLILEEICKSQ